MKKLLAKITILTTLVAPLLIPLTAQAITVPNWDVTGNWVVSFEYLGGFYPHDVTLVQDGSGNLTGSGGHPAGGPFVYTWVIDSGSVSGDAINFTAHYTASADAVIPLTIMNVVGTINPDGTMSGTWSDNYQAGTRGGTWTTTSGGATASAKKVTHIGSLAGASQDGASCGGVWANDTYNLFFTVRNNNDGTYTVTTDYKNGTFTTLAGNSPGKCATNNHHGSSVSGGIKGKFQGWVGLTMTSATFNPNACNTPAVCTTRTDALNAMFPGGTTDGWSWNFEYNSSDKSLSYKHWQDKSNSDGSADVFEGDIANN